MDHIQIICDLLQTDSHVSTSLNFADQIDALSDAQATVSKHLRQIQSSLKSKKSSHFFKLESPRNFGTGYGPVSQTVKIHGCSFMK